MKEQQSQTPDELTDRGTRRTFRDLLGVYGSVFALTIAGFVVAWQFVEPAPPRQLVMATGAPDGAYHLFGLRYREILARHGIELELVNTAGSVENLELLTDPDSNVDVALLQGGIGSEDAAPGLRGLASLFYEPLWIFQHELVPATVPDFTGRQVAVGEPGSGTHAVIRRIIENNELPLAAFESLELGGSAAAEALLNGRADVACFVASIQAPYIKRLLLNDAIHLTPFIRAEAYVRRLHSLANVVLPRGAADLSRDIPPADTRLLAAVASLTAKKELHPTLVVALVEAAEEVHSNGGLFEEQGQFPSAFNMAFPIHEDARRYLEKGPPWLQRYLPFWIAVSVDRLLILLIPLATLLIPLFKIAPPTYRWRIRKRIYSHYRYLLEVETTLLENPSEAVLDGCTAKIEEIEEELAQVNIPLSYADQLYHLRMHVRFVKQRVDLARHDTLPAAP
jgi:TRAP-type uncharacterized transport system substrate-binding protein